MVLLRRRICCAALALLLVAAGCTRTAPQEEDTDLAIPVMVEPVTRGDIRGTVSATGVVMTLPGAQFAIIAPLPGRIADVTRNVGDTVQAGDVLVRFEFPALGPEAAARAATLRAAELRLRSAKLVQERIRGLIAQGAASRMEMDEADREVAAAEGEATEARTSLTAVESQGRNEIIRAPFSGTVTERLHNPGDLVRAEAEDPVLRIIDPRQVQIVATVPIAEISRFAVGASARATAEGQAGPGLLRVLSRPAPEAGATTVPVTLTFDSPTELAPGTQVGIEIDAEQLSNVALVPSIAILRDASGGPAVIVAVGNVAQRRPVVTGLADAERVEIRSGLKAGELVVTQGHADLRDGTPISVSAR
jgi:RND family efflux transporter MFP subunit